MVVDRIPVVSAAVPGRTPACGDVPRGQEKRLD